MTASQSAKPFVSLSVATLPDSAEHLRAEVRQMLQEAQAAGAFVPRCDAWLAGWSPEFSQELGRRGWIGMTWPERYGGRERSAVERFVVSEELLVAGAPVAAHWIADRQSGPQIYRHGSEALRERVLPLIARGECYFALGLSEADSGSDLASVRTRARRIDGGWSVTGSKVWSSGAHHAHYITVLCRTGEPEPSKHSGLSVLAIDLAAPRVTVRPIRLISGEHHFNEVIFENVEVSDEMLLGAEGEGWSLVTSELSLERSGPERILSTMPLLRALVDAVGPDADDRAAEQVGRLVADLSTLHTMSLSVAATIDAGRDPVVEAALVKDLGTRYERRVTEVARTVCAAQASTGSDRRFEVLLAQALLAGPGFTLRGGTNEVLRSIVARGLGLR
jgi:alkylation response protein AidB-like acyl-CoA dehydrogenase